MTAAWGADSRGVLLRSIPRILLQPRFRAVVLFRLSQFAWRRTYSRVFAHWLLAHSIRTAGAEIHPAAVIGPGLGLVHSVGIVVGHEVVAGRDLVLHQGTTLGHGGSGGGQPRLGDRVRVGAGAKILGPISIGDDVTIGANAVVLADVPSGATVVGVWNERTASGR